MSKGRILIAEDERSIRSLFKMFLMSEGYEVEEAADGTEALDAITRVPPDVVLLDLSMPAPQGMEVLERMKNMAIHPRPRVIILTAYGSVQLAVRAMQLGAIDFLEKPSSPDKVLDTIKRVMDEKIMAESLTDDGYSAVMARIRLALTDGDLGKAEKLLMVAGPLGAHDPAYYNLLGLWHEIKEHYPEARKSYGQAIRLNKDFEPAQQNMRRLYELWEFGKSSEEADLG